VAIPAPPWRHSALNFALRASAGDSGELQFDMEPQIHDLFLRHVTASEVHVLFPKRVSVAQQPYTKTLVT
jgi:hypothetical protein